MVEAEDLTDLKIENVHYKIKLVWKESEERRNTIYLFII